MNTNIYLKIQSGLCNQLIPLISAIYCSQKLNKPLIVNYNPIRIMKDNTEILYLYQFIEINNIKVINNFENIIFNLNNKVIKGGWGGKNNIIYKEDYNKNIIFKNICHFISMDDKYKLVGQYSELRLEINDYLSELRTIARNNIILPNIIKEKINYITKKFENKKILGMHIRTQDGGFKDTFNIKKIYNFIENFIHINPEYYIYISIDNIEKEEIIVDKYKEKIMVMDAPFGNSYRDKINSNKYGLMNGLCELYILSKCNKIVGTKSSSFSIYSWILSDLEKLEFW